MLCNHSGQSAGVSSNKSQPSIARKDSISPTRLTTQLNKIPSPPFITRQLQSRATTGRVIRMDYDRGKGETGRNGSRIRDRPLANTFLNTGQRCSEGARVEGSAEGRVGARSAKSEREEGRDVGGPLHWRMWPPVVGYQDRSVVSQPSQVSPVLPLRSSIIASLAR